MHARRLGWARRIGLTVDQAVTKPSRPAQSSNASRSVSDDEERFCYGIGEMARQIVVEGFDRGLIT